MKQINVPIRAVLLFVLLITVCLGCSKSADTTYYIDGLTSRSFTDSTFDYDQLKMQETFHVVQEAYPSCTMIIAFQSESRVLIQGQKYPYEIEDGRILVKDPDNDEEVLVSLEVLPDNNSTSEYVSVQHQFFSRSAAMESGLWIGPLPDSMPYLFETRWYRAKANTGSYPTDIVAAETENGVFLYTANSAGRSVSVIRTPENKVIATIPVNIDPYRLAVSPNGKYVYVTNYWTNSVSVIQTVSNSVIKTIPVERTPNGIAVTGDGAYLLVANTNDESVSVIETESHTVSGTIPLGGRALSYVEVFFSIPPQGENYFLLAIENDCGALIREPDMSDPLCQDNPVSGRCPTKCPATMGRVEMVFSPVEPDDSGFWRTEFLNAEFKPRTYTFLLVENFSGAEGLDLDADDNGVMDYQEISGMEPPWDRIVDAVGVDDSSGENGRYANVMLPHISELITGEYRAGGYSRIPSGEDTDSQDDWIAHNLFSCWSDMSYDEAGIIFLSDIPQAGKSYNTPGQANTWYGPAINLTAPSENPVINEFMVNRKEYTPLGVTAPRSLAPDEESYCYVSTEEGTLLKIRLTDFTVMEKVSVGDGRTDMVLLPNGELYIANVISGSLSIVRNGAVQQTIQMGMGVKDIGASADGQYVYVTNSIADTVAVIRTSDHRVVEVLSPGVDTVGVAAPPEGNYIYVTNEDVNRVSVLTLAVSSTCE